MSQISRVVEESTDDIVSNTNGETSPLWSSDSSMWGHSEDSTFGTSHASKPQNPRGFAHPNRRNVGDHWNPTSDKINIIECDPVCNECAFQLNHCLYLVYILQSINQ